MNIAIIGTGYVGLVSGADFAARGHRVTCVDINEERIAGLNRGVMPFFETGLPELVAAGVAAGRLTFTVDTAFAVNDADIVICAVGTPLGDDGKADLRAVYDVAHAFGRFVTKPAVLVNKSTVPVGTVITCEAIVTEEFAARNVVQQFAVVSNPEFLSQGTAVRDTAFPSRIVVGARGDWERAQMREVNASFIAAGIPYCEMSPASAEVAKCAANAFLATKISFINEIANFCELTGANVDEVAHSMGLDARIGPSFLRAGLGYGGGCIPKDTAALIAAGHEAGYDFRLLPAVQEVNVLQPERLYSKLVEMMPERAGKRIVVWGVAFKPGTDDLRSAPSVPVIERLLADGATVVIYDPAAAGNAQRRFSSLIVAESPVAALEQADALLIFTEWEEFSRITLSEIAEVMQGNLVLDGRGVFRNRTSFPGLKYWTIGQGV